MDHWSSRLRLQRAPRRNWQHRQRFVINAHERSWRIIDNVRKKRLLARSNRKLTENQASRRGRESNPRIEVLQTSALPLGYPAGERISSIAFNSSVSTAVKERGLAAKRRKKHKKDLVWTTNGSFGIQETFSFFFCALCGYSGFPVSTKFEMRFPFVSTLSRSGDQPFLRAFHISGKSRFISSTSWRPASSQSWSLAAAL